MKSLSQKLGAVHISVEVVPSRCFTTEVSLFDIDIKDGGTLPRPLHYDSFRITLQHRSPAVETKETFLLS